jgi:hypothetical protein
MPAPKETGLLTLRTTVVLFCSLVVGLGAGILTYVGTGEAASAALAGVSMFGGAVLWFHKIIAP